MTWLPKQPTRNKKTISHLFLLQREGYEFEKKIETGIWKQVSNFFLLVSVFSAVGRDQKTMPASVSNASLAFSLIPDLYKFGRSYHKQFFWS